MVTLLLVLCLFSLFAQSPDSNALPESDAFLDISFMKGNVVIDDIQPQEIRVKKPIDVQVTSIESAQKLPLRIAIAMDISSSQLPFTNDTREIYLNLIRLLPLRTVDSACLISFNTKLTLVQGMTSDKTLLIRGIDTLTYGGQTKLSDVIFYASKAFHNQGDSRKAMIVFTDGKDNLSEHEMKQAIAEAIHDNIRLYSLLRGDVNFFGTSYHHEFASKTGGRSLPYTFAKSGNEKVAQILDELSHLKRIRLSGMTAEKRASKIEISVSRKGVQAFYPSTIH
jgi:Ca-activated chloride channel homolog